MIRNRVLIELLIIAIPMMMMTANVFKLLRWEKQSFQLFMYMNSLNAHNTLMG